MSGPAQCGALILAADAVISGSDPASLRDQVQELAGAAARFHQRGLWHPPGRCREINRGTAPSTRPRRRLNDKIAMFRTPSARKGSHLIILNRIEKYAALLARQCDDRAVPDIGLDELLPWEPVE
jgi:hypothetical protein